MDKTGSIQVGTMIRALNIVPKSFDREKRTIDVIASFGGTVRQFGRIDGVFLEFNEELSMQRNHVDLKRLNAGAPVLDNHARKQGGISFMSVRDSLGRTVPGSFKLETVDGQRAITGKVELSDRPEVKELDNDFERGIIKDISLGYTTTKLQRVGTSKKDDNTIPTFRAIQWQPFELSFTPAGAEIGPRTRGKEEETYSCEILEERSMDPTTEENTTENNQDGEKNKNGEDGKGERTQTTESTAEVKPEPITPTPSSASSERSFSQNDLDKAAGAALERERNRLNGIQTTCRSLGLGDEFTRTLETETGLTVDSAREKAIVERVRLDKERGIVNGSNVAVIRDEKETFVRGISDCFLHSYDPVSFKEEGNENSNQYRGMTLMDVARECLERHGEKTRGMDRYRIAERALHTTTDFPEILADTVGRSLRRGYTASPQTFDPFTRRVQEKDFREISRTQLHTGTGLEELTQHGEFKRGTVSESAEKYKIRPYGKIIGITREIIVNDDLGAFTRIPAQMGSKVAELESDLVWAIITVNANMADGNALYSAAHGNLGAAADAGAPSITTAGHGRESLRLQQDDDGQVLNLLPSWIYVPVALETVAEQLVAMELNPDQISNTNPFGPGGRSRLQLGVEPRLDAASQTEWYEFSNLGQIDMVELARLSSEDGPTFSTRQGFDIDGVEFKVAADRAAKAIDWRGMYKNNG